MVVWQHKVSGLLEWAFRSMDIECAWPARLLPVGQINVANAQAVKHEHVLGHRR